MKKPKLIRIPVKKGEVVDMNAALKRHGIEPSEVGVKALGTMNHELKVIGPISDRQAGRLRGWYDMVIIYPTCDDCAARIEDDDKDAYMSEITKKGVSQYCGKCAKKRDLKPGKSRESWSDR